MAAHVRPVTVVVLGAPRVGKSALATRLCGGSFLSQYTPTLTPLVCRISLEVDDQRWGVKVIDVGGLHQVGVEFLLSADGYLLVYDVTDLRSLRFARLLNARLLETLAEPLASPEAARVLVGTHSDVPQDLRQVPKSVAEDTAQQIQAPFLEISALTGDGCMDALIAVVRLVRDGVTPANNDDEPKPPERDEPKRQTAEWGCVLA